MGNADAWKASLDRAISVNSAQVGAERVTVNLVILAQMVMRSKMESV